MKKLSALLIAAALCAVLTACESEPESGQDPENNAQTENQSADNTPETEDGKQIVRSTLNPRIGYPDITVKAGIPVKWIFTAKAEDINSCNNRFIVKEYNIDHTFTVGENVIEFTPEKAGVFPYACWMDMIRATITVEE